MVSNASFILLLCQSLLFGSFSFSILGRGSMRSVSYVLPMSPKQRWGWGLCTGSAALQLLAAQPCSRGSPWSRAGLASGLHTGANSCVQWDETWLLAAECHLLPSLLHLSAGIWDGEIAWLISLSSSQASRLQHRTPCPAAAALCLFFSFLVKCLQGIFLKPCKSTVGVCGALSVAAHPSIANGACIGPAL